MDSYPLLGFLDDASRSQAFELCLQKLKLANPLDLGALKLCIQLRPPLGDNGSRTEDVVPTEQLLELLMHRIPKEPQDPNHYYALAEVLLSDGTFANVLFRERVYPALDTIFLHLSQSISDDENADEDAGHVQEDVHKARAYLNLLRGSYWLPSGQNHMLSPQLLGSIARFISMQALDQVAHDTLSSLLSLLKRAEPIVAVQPSQSLLPPWLKFDESLGRTVLVGPIIDCSVWDHISHLGPERFKSNSSTIFRTWFQWISQVENDKIKLNCLNEDTYWERLQTGLVHGFADQRKYCIGIIRQSLLAAQDDICMPTMRFQVAERDKYLKAYDQYSALFETIVLDRYANQVQACLPELTKLLNSKVTPRMITTLLSAALNPTIQEGVRKIIGNWYMNYVIKDRGELHGHTQFLLAGFIPWATIGDLFTSTLVSTRSKTYCTHGAALASVISRFVSEAPSPTTMSGPTLFSTRRDVFSGILDFILNARGKIFQVSILYLLEGLIKGLKDCKESLPLGNSLSQLDLEKLLRVSRLPGLPEVASDLYCDYCYRLYELATESQNRAVLAGYTQLQMRAQSLGKPLESTSSAVTLLETTVSVTSLEHLMEQLDESQHGCIQGDQFTPACKELMVFLDQVQVDSLDPGHLYGVLDAFWEEADRRQFSRAIAVHIPSLLFHPTCIQICVAQAGINTEELLLRESLLYLLSKALDQLQRLSEGRPYIVSNLAIALRKALYACPHVLHFLPIEDYIIRFITNPPAARVEFLFEVAAAEKLQQYHPHRTYFSYYGEREWCSYAATIDLIQRWPTEHVIVARRILDRLLEPWKKQRSGVPIISKWKNVLELQSMLLLTDFCIPEDEVDTYLEAFRHALVLEPWPRYRFLLEWTIARIYCRFPGKTFQILDDLGKLDENSSIHIASLMKLAVLVAPHETETFSAKFMTQLVPLSASPKVQIRHESNYAIPIIFDLAKSNGWKTITDNPAFSSLNAFIRRLDKFNLAPWTIRTLKLDAINDFNLVNIFQGQYLTIESPKKECVTYEDFEALQAADEKSRINVPTARIAIGTPPKSLQSAITSTVIKEADQPVTLTTQTSPAFFQTKSGFDINSLHPPSGAPDSINKRPASVILIASLIENPTNLGGLSRISESFGLEALYIDDLKKIAHKDFKATSVTSEKHFPIRELKLASVPEFLLDAKSKGYEVVGIEQTDRSGILGTNVSDSLNSKDLGSLPRKCVLVLGSEKGGISAEVLAAIDRCVEIRTVGVTRSLNVQTAGGIAVYEWWREWAEQY